MARGERKRQDTTLASRVTAGRESELDASALDQRRSALAVRATHDNALPLRTRAIQRLSQQYGNRYVARSLGSRARAASIDVKQVDAPAGVLAREEEAGGSDAVTVNNTPSNSTYPVTGKTLAQAFRSISAYADAHDGEAGSVRWAPKWTLTPDSDGYVEKVTVTANIVKTMPNWPGAKDLSEAAAAEWNRVYAELNAHEESHVTIFKDGARYIGNSALGSKLKEANAAAEAARVSTNSDSKAIDPFTTTMTTDIE